MNIVGLESLDEDSVHVYQKTELISELESIQARVATEGMSRDDAVLLQRIVPGIFEDVNLNKFTVNPSTTKQGVAIEAIDWKRGAIMFSAAMAIVTIIGKIISWLSSSLESTGAKSGGIKDIDKTNAKIEKRCQDNVESEVVTDDHLRKVGSEIVKKVGKLSNVNTHYVNKLVSLSDGGKVVNADGKQIAPNDVSNAVNKYVDAIKRTRATDRDNQLHALLGYMLLSKHGGVPLTLNNLDWKGGNGKYKLGYDNIASLELTIILANEVIDEIGTLAASLDSTNYNTLSVVDDTNIDGSVGGGRIIHGLMGKSVETLSRLRNKFVSNHSLRYTYDQAMLTEIVDGNTDHASLGKVIPSFSNDVKQLIELMNNDANTYITFWDKSDYQSYTNKVDAAKYVDILTNLADPRSRESLAALYNMVYSSSSSVSTPKTMGALTASNERLKIVSKLVDKLSKHAGTPERAWLNMPFVLPSTDVNRADSAAIYTPMNQLRNLLDTASALCRRSAELTSVINLGLRDADRAIKMTEKMK